MYLNGQWPSVQSPAVASLTLHNASNRVCKMLHVEQKKKRIVVDVARWSGKRCGVQWAGWPSARVWPPRMSGWPFRVHGDPSGLLAPWMLQHLVATTSVHLSDWIMPAPTVLSLPLDDVLWCLVHLCLPTICVYDVCICTLVFQNLYVHVCVCVCRKKSTAGL